MILSGTVSQPFSFTYTGGFTDNRDANGKGTIRLNTSGVLTISGKATVASVIKVVAGGGGASAWSFGSHYGASGGGGGTQIVELGVLSGVYEIVIGSGGAANQDGAQGSAGGKGGDTTAFGVICSGGTGGIQVKTMEAAAGTGGSPNGGNGTTDFRSSVINISGGTPNGGGVVADVAQAGGDGYVELTFS